MSLSTDETTLRDGYRLKPIGNRFVLLNEGGMAVGREMRTESLAVKRLIDHRIAHTQRQKFLAQQQEAKRA